MGIVCTAIVSGFQNWVRYILTIIVIIIIIFKKQQKYRQSLPNCGSYSGNKQECVFWNNQKSMLRKLVSNFWIFWCLHSKYNIDTLLSNLEREEEQKQKNTKKPFFSFCLFLRPFLPFSLHITHHEWAEK